MIACDYGYKHVVKLLLECQTQDLIWMQKIEWDGLHLCSLAKVATKMLSNCSSKIQTEELI